LALAQGADRFLGSGLGLTPAAARDRAVVWDWDLARVELEAWCKSGRLRRP